MEVCKKSVCFVCRGLIALPKEYNFRRHFETELKDHTILDESERKIKDIQLSKALSAQQNIFSKVVSQKSVPKLSPKISREVAVSARPFAEGEFIRKCMLIGASELCPGKKTFNNIGLTWMIVQRKIALISNNLHDQLQNKAAIFIYYSLATDKCADVKDTAQILVFLRAIDDKFQITEHLAGMCPMHGRTTGEEISNELMKCH
jgi:hypothetical protein